MSTIKVDTYLTRGGASEIAIDKLKGASSAGSMTVVGEGGTTTTNLQQGLCKAWISADPIADNIDDSLNVASMTDNATGRRTINYTNNMNSANYVGGALSQAMMALYGTATDDPSHMTTSSLQWKSTSDTSSLVDFGKTTCLMIGDLA